MTGTMCARLALGDDLVTAVWLGSAAASLCVGGQGGTGYVPSLDTTTSHLAAYRAATEKAGPTWRP
jgi:2-dehydro-3-deoxygluconokinase